MASPRERDHRTSRPQLAPARRHHFHDVPPWPHQRYHDYVNVDGYGWWPRWFPYWNQRWYTYWWRLYDFYGGDGNPEYAEYARDDVLRQNAPSLGLVVGADPGAIVRDHRVHFGMPSAAHHPIVTQQPWGGQQYPHPHDHYRDYSIVNGAWWPQWFPYWDAAWRAYWAQLYVYYGGDARADYAQYARDAHLRADARRRGWL